MVKFKRSWELSQIRSYATLYILYNKERDEGSGLAKHINLKGAD